MFRLTLLFLIVLFGSQCKSNKANGSGNPDVDQQAITANWYLLSTDNSVKIFSSNKEEITPRRGYESLLFNADGTCTRTVPGPTDRPEVKSGTWRWKSANELSLIIDEVREVLQINSLSTDRLEIIIQ